MEHVARHESPESGIAGLYVHTAVVADIHRMASHGFVIRRASLFAFD